MGFFDRKPKEDSRAKLAIARLTGENQALRMTLGILLRHSPDRQAVLDDMAKGAGVLRHNAFKAGSHPLLASSVDETLSAIRRMSAED